MQKFINPETGLQHHFDPDVNVEVIQENGADVYVFITSYGEILDTPKTLIPEPPEYVPPPLPVFVPPFITKAQGKAVLIQARIWEDALGYVAAIQDPIDKALAEVALNDTNDWRRDSPFLNEAAQAIGLTQPQIDDFFIFGSQILL